MFDRDWEWSELTAFATDGGAEATMTVVSGRRRLGKSFLLDSLARTAGGFYFCAHEATEAESLRRFGEELGQYTGSIAPMRSDRWEQGVDALLALGKDRPVPVVIDEFPYLPLLDRGLAEQVWAGSRSRFLSAVVGPHFEQICREWVAHFAAPETFGGMPIDVSYGTVPDRAARSSHEIDVVVHGAVGQDNGVLLALGEAKWDQTMGLGHLERLRRAAALLAGRGSDTSAVRLVCFSGAGFTDGLRAAASRGEAVLVDLDRLYSGE